MKFRIPFRLVVENNLSLIFLLFLNTFFFFAQEQIGRPPIINYSYEDYGGAPINWWILEGDNGIMYFANTQGVLEFDGVTWNLIKIGKNQGIRCLAKNSEGTIFLGSGSDFGYLEINNTGEYSYKSLRDKVPEEHRTFAEVWEVDYFEDDIIFRTTDKLYIWDGETIDVLVSDNPFHVGNIVHDKYYVRIWNKGLCVMEDKEFKLVPGGEKFADERIYVMLPYDEERMLIGTRTMGFFLFDGETYTPFKTEIDDLVGNSIYLPGEALADGRFVINSFSNGAYLIDHDGKLLQKYTPTTGLQNGSVDFVYMDSRGILWFALFNGISRVDLNSPFTYFNSNIGLNTDVVWDIYNKDGVIYIGSNDGIYYLEKGADKIKKIEGTFGQASNFIEIDGRLYIGTGDMGLLEIKDKSYNHVRESVNYDFRVGALVQSKKDPNRLFVGHSDGLTSMYFDEQQKQFIEESFYPIVQAQGVGAFAEDSDGTIWINTSDPGVIRIISPNFTDGKLDFEDSEISTLTTEDGLPEEIVTFNEIFDQRVFYGRDRRTYEFDTVSRKFREKEFFFNDYLGDLLPTLVIPNKDENNKLFFHPGGGVIVAQKDGEGGYIVNSESFRELKNKSITQVRPQKPDRDGNQVVWLTGADGIIKYEGNLESPMVTDFDLKIRSMSIAGDSLVYGGASELPEDLKIAYADNTVVISFAAPLYKNQQNVEYSTYLEGLDQKWSEWTKQTSKEYINLPPGNYTFKAKARSLYGNTTPETTVSFSIATPWYRTWWAYLLYALGFLLIVYAIFRQRTQLLRNRQAELEKNVQARTQEVQQRLDELATVNTVSRTLTEKIELKDLIQKVGEEMKRLFKSDITYVAIVDKENKIINFPYQDGDTIAPQHFGQGLTSKIITTGEPLLINKDVDITAEYEKMGLKGSGKPAISYLGVPIPSEDEIVGVLSVQSTEVESRFNEQDKRLLNTIALNVGIALHNAELFEEAKEAKAKAEDANEAKSAFLSTVSHELRTPLTSVLGFAKIIRKRLEDKIFPAITSDDPKLQRSMAQVSENLDVVVSEGERLTTLINDVLDLAKIESGKMDWNMKPVFLQDVINRAVSSTQALFDSKKLKLEKNIPSDLPLVNADEDKLIQVVINLLSNAVKFTNEGKVTINAYPDKGQIIVEVQDTGIGISEDDKNKVFEKFRQAGDTLTDKPKGTGLGLPICREIIEHHGGIIWMKSKPGEGSTFFFSIPALGDTVPNQPMQLDRILNSLKKQIKHSASSKAKSVPTILVVDDDTPIRSLLRQELGDAGYNIQEAANGKAALDMVRHSKPDLIILDVMMPEINGFDVAAVLKNDPATMDIPIIILSIVQDKERGLKIGVDRYLTKPINTEQLFHEVDSLLEQGVSKKKVLVVDEDSSALKTLSEVLTARGYKVMESNPTNLVQTATESQPDIIMLNSVYNGNPDMIKDLKSKKGMENVMFFIYE